MDWGWAVANVADFVPHIQALVPAADEPTLSLFIRDVIVQFMEDTQVFVAEECLVGQDCVREYILDPPQCREIVSININEVRVDGCERRVYRDGHENVIIFEDDIEEGARITVPYAWKIQRYDCEVPDKIFQDYLPVIREGVLSLLHRSSQDNLVSARRAAVAEQNYQDKVAAIKARKIARFSTSRPRMRNPMRRRRYFPWR